MKFKQWLMKEIFDQPATYKWINNFQASFIIDDLNYFANLDYNDEEDMLHIQFYLEKDNRYQKGITGTGNAGVVFGTIIQILLDYLRKNGKPNIIEFDAANPVRQRIYTQLFARFLPEYRVGIGKEGEMWASLK